MRPHFTAHCIRFLRPLARVLLRYGLSAYDFSKIAHTAFVLAAQDILRERGQSASFSRVSAITGLHRHVVSDIFHSVEARDEDPGADKEYQRNRLVRVLSGWFESPDYTGADGRPLVLPLEGPAPSFAELVRAFSGDIYPRIILEELQRAGAVRMTKQGKVRAVSRRYVHGGADPESLVHLGAVAGDLLCTLEHNLSASAQERYFEDAATSFALDAKAVPLLKQLVQRRGSNLLEDIDGWMSEREQRDSSQPTVRARFGMHLYVEEPDKTEE